MGLLFEKQHVPLHLMNHPLIAYSLSLCLPVELIVELERARAHRLAKITLEDSFRRLVA